MDMLPLLATQTHLPGVSAESFHWVGDLGGWCGFGGSVQMKHEFSSFLILFISNLYLHPKLCILTSMSPDITSGIQMQRFQLRDSVYGQCSLGLTKNIKLLPREKMLSSPEALQAAGGWPWHVTHRPTHLSLESVYQRS